MRTPQKICAFGVFHLKDKTKCACQQMTVESTTVSGGKKNPEAGYRNRRLQEPIVTG